MHYFFIRIEKSLKLAVWLSDSIWPRIADFLGVLTNSTVKMTTYIFWNSTYYRVNFWFSQFGNIIWQLCSDPIFFSFHSYFWLVSVRVTQISLFLESKSWFLPFLIHQVPTSWAFCTENTDYWIRLYKIIKCSFLLSTQQRHPYSLSWLYITPLTSNCLVINQEYYIYLLLRRINIFVVVNIFIINITVILLLWSSCVTATTKLKMIFLYIRCTMSEFTLEYGKA